MNPIIKNILAVIAGIILGGVVNMGIITISSSIIPPPEGHNLTTEEGLIAAMPFLEPKHFIMPFLAHALGAFVGALVAGLLAANHKMKFALGMGVFTLIGGITAVFIFPAPTWFAVADLVFAYIPMGYLAGILAVKNSEIRG